MDDTNVEIMSCWIEVRKRRHCPTPVPHLSRRVVSVEDVVGRARPKTSLTASIQTGGNLSSYNAIIVQQAWGLRRRPLAEGKRRGEEQISTRKCLCVKQGRPL